MTSGGTLPTRMKLKPSKLKWAVILLIAVGFVAACVFVIPRDDDPTMWGLSVVFFSICALGSLPGLLGVGGLGWCARRGMCWENCERAKRRGAPGAWPARRINALRTLGEARPGRRPALPFARFCG
jgi:hypothetical protein